MARRKQKTESQIQDSLRMKAERKVRNKTGLLWFLYNLGSYVIVNGILIAIWVLSDSNYPWFLWVVLIWAAGLAFHFAGYIVGFRYGASRERMIREQVESYRKKMGQPPISGPETAPSPATPETEQAGQEPADNE